MAINPLYEIKMIDKKIHKIVDLKHSEIEKQELTPMENWIMCYLSKNRENEVYQKDIENLLNLSRSTVAEKLSHMENLGYIKRHLGKKDQRQKVICLDTKGKAVSDAIENYFHDLEYLVVDGFSDEERIQLIDFLERINNNLEKEKLKHEKEEN